MVRDTVGFVSPRQNESPSLKDHPKQIAGLALVVLAAIVISLIFVSVALDSRTFSSLSAPKLSTLPFKPPPPGWATKTVYARKHNVDEKFMSKFKLTNETLAEKLIAFGAPPHGEDFEVSPPVQNPYFGALSVIFLTRRGLSTPEIWSWWFADAERWAAARFPEQVATLGVDAVVDLRVHFRKDADKEGLPGGAEIDRIFAPNMRRLVERPARCAWGKTVGCMERGLKSALENKKSGMFLFVSDSTVPVVPFSDIYESLANNTRSRFFFSSYQFQPFPKHHQWVALTRSHAEILAASPRWKCGWKSFNNTEYHKKMLAADDEHCTFAALALEIGEKQFWREINNGHLIYRTEAEMKEVFRRDTFGRKTYVIWRPSECRKTGTVATRKLPCLFGALKHETFSTIIENPDVWFFRKVSPTARVEFLAGSVPVSDYLRIQLRRARCDKCDEAFDAAANRGQEFRT